MTPFVPSSLSSATLTYSEGPHLPSKFDLRKFVWPFPENFWVVRPETRIFCSLTMMRHICMQSPFSELTVSTRETSTLKYT